MYVLRECTLSLRVASLWLTASCVWCTLRLRKAVIAATVVLLAGEPQSQVTTVLLLTMLSLVWHVLAAPYVARVTDTLETLSLLIQTGTLVLAQVRGAVWP